MQSDLDGGVDRWSISPNFKIYNHYEVPYFIYLFFVSPSYPVNSPSSMASYGSCKITNVTFSFVRLLVLELRLNLIASENKSQICRGNANYQCYVNINPAVLQ